MSKKTIVIRKLYEQEAGKYVEFHKKSFNWKYIEKPGFDKYISIISSSIGPLHSSSKVLDIGCGGGILTSYLVEKGIKPGNITGIDLSPAMIAEARKYNPGSVFQVGRADDFNFQNDSHDLVVSCMLIHYLDNTQLNKSFELIRKTLKTSGYCIIVDADLAYNQATQNPDNFDTWFEFPTPWGSRAPWFCRSPDKLVELAHNNHLTVIQSETLSVAEEGRVEKDMYKKYTSYPARFGMLLQNSAR